MIWDGNEGNKERKTEEREENRAQIMCRIRYYKSFLWFAVNID